MRRVTVLPSITTLVLCVFAISTARRIGHRDVVRPWASVHSPTPAHVHGTLYLQHSVTPPTANDSENYSKHTCLIQYLSLSVFVMHAWTCM